MKNLPQRLSAAVLATFALASPLHAQGLRIEGMRPFENRASGTARPELVDGALRLELAGGGTLRVTPWPDFLPREFGEQRIDAENQPGPAGPSVRLRMSAVEGGGAWLRLASGARRSTTVVGGWQLKFNGRGWWLAQGQKLHFLGMDPADAQVVRVPSGMDRWCVYLLDSRVPQARPGIADEQEAQASWAALRTASPGQACPQPQ